MIQDPEYFDEVAQKLLEIFGGNPYHSRAKEIKGDLTYHPIEVPLSTESVKAHLQGHMTLGSYQLIQGANIVRWLGWDVDSLDLNEARKMSEKILSHLTNVPHVVEFSGRKGYHILIFLKEPMPANKAKKIVEWVREAEGLSAMGDSHVECYPKQDRLNRARPKGNLLKLPLGEHPKSHDISRFVDPHNGWENGPLCDPRELLSYRATSEEVQAIVESGPEPMDQIIELLADYWIEGKRHDISLYLCGFLANEGWGYEQVAELMTALVERTGDDDLYNRQETVKTTFERFSEGKSIRGRQGLGEYLPVTALQKLTELSSMIQAPDTVTQVDDIRYLKGKPKIEAIRLACATIWGILNDEGDRVIQTNENVAYWYNHETHLITREGTELWDSVLNGRFGLNPVDNFSRMTSTELRLRIVREAPFVPIRNRTYWSTGEKKLYVNLGGPEVYIVSGRNKVEKAYNGECGQIFVTNDSGRYLEPDLDNQMGVDAWDHLVDDLSFTTSEDAPASPEEQKELLKAWLLAFFFQELLPTRPILALIGEPGSGKTTAIRRILRIVEDPFSDVLGVPTDKQDAFRTSIESHRLLVLDNLEKSGAWWMVDMLNKLSTGSHIEVRKLYKTNEKHVIIPQCFVACTAVNVPFSDETLFSRLLVLEMEKLFTPLPEYILQRRIAEYGPSIWGDLLLKLGEVVEVLRADEKIKVPTSSRLADFTMFCERIKNSGVVDGDNLSSGLLSMIDSQLKQLKESSPAIQLLEDWIMLRPDEASEWHSIHQLYEILREMAQARKVNFRWRSSNALWRHLGTLESRLRKDFQAELRRTPNPISRKEDVMIKFDVTLV